MSIEGEKQIKIGTEIPNYTGPKAKSIEESLPKLIETITGLGFNIVELDFSAKQLIDAAAEMDPDRLRLVKEKLSARGSDLEKMSPRSVLDKLYGVDLAVSYNEKIYFIDVTTAKATSIKNKIDKFYQLEKLLRSIGCDHAVVLSIRENKVNERVALKLAEALDAGEKFVLDVRLRD
jgi:uncharacterized secreted protein with C-terminal beta-propeller domain